MGKFKANQKLLFKAENVSNLKPLEKYEILFSFLDISSLAILYPAIGRPHAGYRALLKALIYKNMKNMSYLSDLARELRNHPDLVLVFDFHPFIFPRVENFSVFLGNTDNGILQEVRNFLVRKLIELKEFKGNYLAFDSSNIMVKLKQNNLKTAISGRFDKNRKPKGDPESRLNIMVCFPKCLQKEIRYFLSY